jgi:hypothetical protein
MNKCNLGWSEESGNRSGSCCCNCRWQRPITAHPWNRHELTRGPITKNIGWGCTVPDMPGVTFFEVEHSMCEMHTWKNEDQVQES